MSKAGFRVGLKNLAREECYVAGRASWSLKRLNGERVVAFDAFCKSNVNFSFDTQRRYALSASRFVDFLVELQVLDQILDARHLNAAVDGYGTLLVLGSAEAARRMRLSGSNCDLWLAHAMSELDWGPMRPNSLTNTIAAANRFCFVLLSLEREAADRCLHLGIASAPMTARIDGLDGHIKRGAKEVIALRQNSLLGSVARVVSGGLKRPRGLCRQPVGSGQVLETRLDFPFDELPQLISAAGSWRDASLWLLLGCAGIRISEALNLHFDDVEMAQQRVLVFDPRERRVVPAGADPFTHRFKGRSMAATYLLPPLQQRLFHALRQYLRFEFKPSPAAGRPTYFFQCISRGREGTPLKFVSDSAVAKSFKAAVRRAHITPRQDGREWTLQSLRHMYGVYMRNDLQVDSADGQNGLEASEVQLAMGHASPTSTQHYARKSRRSLVLKLEQADRRQTNPLVIELDD